MTIFVEGIVHKMPDEDYVEIINKKKELIYYGWAKEMSCRYENLKVVHVSVNKSKDIQLVVE